MEHVMSFYSDDPAGLAPLASIHCMLYNPIKKTNKVACVCE